MSELLSIFHNVLPRELKKVILRIWFTNYYREFCRCGAKKEKGYKYDSTENKFYRECVNCDAYFCHDIKSEMKYIWPYVDQKFEIEVLRELTYLNAKDIQTFNNALYQYSSFTRKMFITIYNHIFMECNKKHHEKDTYFTIAWQLYKARKRNVSENIIAKVCKCAKILERYFIPNQKGLLVGRGFFECEINEFTELYKTTDNE